MKQLPKHIRRIDDGFLFVLGEDNLYRMREYDYIPHSYSYEQIMSCVGKFEEVKEAPIRGDVKGWD